MNEVKKVHLDRQQFTISLEAHKALRNYLEAIEKQPGVQAEVVREVEVRMAELLTERGITADKVVLQEDVDFLQAQLGEPRDFKDENSDDAATDAADTEQSDTPRQLYRDPEHGMIAGVAAGLAAYFKIDVLIVRLLFAVMSFVGAAGIVMYILLWILAPEAKTSSDKLKMRGKAVTVDSIKAAVDRADIPGATQRAGRTVGRAAQSLGEGILKLIAVVLGSFCTAFGSLVIVMSVMVGSLLLFQGFKAGDELIFPVDNSEYLALVAAMMTGLVLGLMVVLGGISLFRRKGVVSGWVVAGMAGLLVVSVSAGAGLGIDGVQSAIERYHRAHHTYTRTLPNFTRVELEGKDTRFTFKPSKEYSVELSYLGKLDENAFSTNVENGILKMDTNKFAEPLCKGFCTGYNDRDLEVTIHAPSLEQVNISGEDASFANWEPLTQQNMTVVADVATDVRLAYMRPHQIDITVMKAGERTKKVQLTGLQPGASSDDLVRLSADDGLVIVDEATVVGFNTDVVCEGHNPVVLLGTIPMEIQTAGKVIKSAAELRDLQSFDQQNAYNCIGTPQS